MGGISRVRVCVRFLSRRGRGEHRALCANPETGWRVLTGEPDGGYLGVTGEQARPERQPHLDNPATPALIHGPGSAAADGREHFPET